MLTGLDRRFLRQELSAGVVLAALAIPLNIDYAQIAGLPPTAGLYALILPVVEVDGRPIGDGRPGAITSAIREAYVERLVNA